MGSDTRRNLTQGTFQVTLGAPEQISGMKMYPVSISGNGGELRPRWSYLGADRLGRIFGVASQSAELVPVFDSTGRESWPGAGFLTDFEGRSIDANDVETIWTGQQLQQVNFYSGRATQVGYSLSQRNCVSGRDVGLGSICTDEPNIYRTHYEYWSADYGPVAMHYNHSYNDCGGGFCSHARSEIEIDLIAVGDASQSAPLRRGPETTSGGN